MVNFGKSRVTLMLFALLMAFWTGCADQADELPDDGGQQSPPDVSSDATTTADTSTVPGLDGGDGTDGSSVDSGSVDGGADGGSADGGLLSSEFVTVDPDQPRFLLDGEPFYFAGTNLYWMVSQRVYDASFVDESFDMCVDIGLRVIRFWGFADGDSWTNSGDPAIMQPEAGVFDERAFEALDYVIAEAGEHDLKVIIPFVNYWEAYGGMLQYARWAGGDSREYFYTDEVARQMYKDYVEHVLTRVNTITGITYRDDPTIMAWQLANEARAPFDGGARDGTLNQWYAEMSAHVRSIDPNHLIATGSEGWDVPAHRDVYSDGYTNDYALSGAEGSSFTDNTALTDISCGSAHMYPDVWGYSDAVVDGRMWIADHASIARQQGKPFVLGEFGSADRSVYEGWLQTVEDEDVAGSLMWQIVPASRGRENAMTVVYPDDAALVTLFREHAQRMNSK